MIENNKEMVKFLIDNGADVNLQDKDGSIPLHLTMIENNKEMVKFLIDNGADVNLQDKDGSIPLHLTMIENNKEMVKLLLDNGADTSIKIENCLISFLFLKYKKNIKIENLLKNFQNLKSKIESLNKKLEKTQNEEEKTKIKNNLKQIEKELETLLKIELSDVITQTELEEISNNSSQTILNCVKELNSNVDINQVKIQDNSITDTTAIIESI
ncbi:ankyrin repeat domain-containing protein [Spiroplasma endosymbiont of Poecilobothrus nobilitatus]|uniref:ankyrin repeat domain-containing protein n=1 Tax=Spiroplasma endosymbiont of Poecilobothrus nobilitatus TaxID=1209220 RepID=UPI00313E6456